MNTTVLVEVRSVYGKQRIYPANATAEHFTSLVGQKTLTMDHLRVIQALGYAVETVSRALDLSTNAP
jgi:hypothetical protein